MVDQDGIAVVVGEKGRLVVPAQLRRRLGIRAGDVLYAKADGDSLVLHPRSAFLARLRRRYAAVPEQVSMSDELIAQRREEGRREDDA